MESAPLVALYARLRALPWASLTLDGGTESFPYRLLGRLAARQVTITADTEPRAPAARWIVEIDPPEAEGRNRAEFHLFDDAEALAAYLQRLSQEDAGTP